MRHTRTGGRARQIEIRALETSDHDAVVKLSLRAWAPNYASMKSVKRAALGLALTDHATEWLRAGMQVAMIGTGGDGGHASVSTSKPLHRPPAQRLLGVGRRGATSSRSR
jgi:hypothetical protein